MSTASSSSPVNSFYSSGGVLRMNGTEFASGLDTQAMITALTSKISSQIDTQKQMEQKTEWKRDMFREVEDLLQKFSDNYFSYSTNSSTNIMSRSFFDSQALVSSNSDIVTATGAAQDAGNVTVNNITQMAKSAEFSSGYQSSRETIDSAGALGTMVASTSYVTLQYNNANYKIALGSGIDTAGKSNADVASIIKDDFQKQIDSNDTLKDHVTITTDGSGAVTVNGAKIVESSNNFTNLGITTGATSSSFTVDNAKLSSTATQLAGVSVTFQLDGLSKNIVFENSESDLYSTPEGIRSYLQEKLDGAFGSGKITVGGSVTSSGGTVTNNSLSFSVADSTSVLQIASATDYGVLQTDGVLRIASGETNRTETSKTLGDLKSELNTPLTSTSTEDVTESDGSVHHGVPVYEFTINGQSFKYNDETELNTVINDISNNNAAGVTVSYSQTLNEFRIMSDSTGSQENIAVKDTTGNLMASLFGGNTVVASGDVAVADYTDPTKTSTYSFQLGGTTQNIAISGNASNSNIEGFATSVQTSVDGAFGANKIRVGITDDGKGLTFESISASNKLTVKSAPATGDTSTDMLGIGTTGQSALAITQGSDLKMNVTLSGTAEDITRSTNSFTLDGITMNVKNETNDKVSFSPSADVDDLYKKISTFVDDYNKIIDKVNTYATQAPYGLGGSNGQTTKYDPLTDAQKKAMTDTEITEWNDKAKQGLLFDSPELTSLQSSIRTAMESSVSSVGMSLTDVGISTKAYDWTSGGELVINETQLKNALTSDPDKVAQLFTNTDGIAQRVKSVINDNIGAYSNNGVLFNMAGSNNMIGVDNSQLSKEMSEYDTSIKDLQSQLQDEQDRWQTKFTNMETVIYQLMNQSNYLSSMSSGS